MIYEFADDYKTWFNKYFISRMVAVDWGTGKLVPIENPRHWGICFLLGYTGSDTKYNGWIVTDGVRYAYVVDDIVVRDLQENHPLNLYCRSMIRAVIREYLDEIEQWPIK